MILLQAPQAGAGANLQTMLLFGGMIMVFYFFLIRPQQKKQKEAKKFRDSLKKGDNVITAGGIYGKVVAVEGETVQIEVDRGMKLKMQKSSISNENSGESIPATK